MRVEGLLAACAVIAAATGSQAGVHPPEIEARLDRLIGDWTIPGAEATYRENCEWWGDKAFVVCTTQDTSDNSASRSILGYSNSDGVFTYLNYGSAGGTRTLIGFADGDTGIVYTGERRTAAGVVRTQTYLRPLPDGRVSLREDRSTNGGAWERGDELAYVRRQSDSR